MKIDVHSATDTEIQQAKEWPIWEKEVSTFDWSYNQEESCYILEGEATVSYDGGSTNFKKGDFVIFPKGLSCTWNITQNIKKHYNFK